MIKAFKFPSLYLPIFSIVVIYFLAPSLDRRQGVLVSLTFALLLILSSRVIIDARHLFKYLFYAGVSIYTYHILFDDEPWNSFFKAGLFDSTAAPLIYSSIMMTLNGALILHCNRDRVIYALITLGLQVPFVFLIGTDMVQSVFSSFAHRLHYNEDYAGYLQVWQFEWMLTYYLPIYILNHRKD